MKAMNLWVREKVVTGVENTVSFAGYIFFLVSKEYFWLACGVLLRSRGLRRQRRPLAWHVL
jgi:hypothetical protein